MFIAGVQETFVLSVTQLSTSYMILSTEIDFAIP